jgi:hypothetical protein
VSVAGAGELPAMDASRSSQQKRTEMGAGRRAPVTGDGRGVEGVGGRRLGRGGRAGNGRQQECSSLYFPLHSGVQFVKQ